jgi:crotonobetainyl-CoA:carnitine CoA-transferase CaiB-like acyl-CoA transferase
MERVAPLAGVRIVDLSMFMSGPLVTLIAADMGADVIKVESLQRLDGWRGAAARREGIEHPWEAAPSFNWINRSKRDITLNLNDPRGAALLKQLVAIADAVVENYTPRVMKNFGLDYDELRRINPNIVMLSMPGFGMTGSWRDYAAFAWTTEQMAAICQLTGYEGGEPLFTGTTGGDPLAGLMGAIALFAALNHRRTTGEGQFIDLSQVEASTSFVGDVLMDAALTGRNPTRQGNRNQNIAPHGIYPCRDAVWLAIACRSDQDWQTLARLLGLVAADATAVPYPRLADRLAAAALLDERVANWTSTQDARELMHRLQGAGIAAGVVMNGKDLLEDPHLREREFFIPQDRAEIGVKHYPGEPFRLAEAVLPEPRRSPYLGEANNAIFRDLLGLCAEECSDLERDDITGTVPVAAR